MKKVTLPAQNEEAIYYSDFSGKCFGEIGAPVELKLVFSYGSKFDGSHIKLDLSDEDVEQILDLISTNLTSDVKDLFNNQLTKLREHYEDSMQLRDWTGCEMISNDMRLIERIIGDVSCETT